MRKFLLILLLATFAMAGFPAGSHEVLVTYQGETASVEVSEDIKQFVTYQVSGADVVVEQSAAVTDEITYRLSGEAADGSFLHKGEFKITLSFEGLHLTSLKGAAVQVKNGKRIAIVLKDGTENDLTDMEDGPQKACMVVKGHGEFQGSGSLVINGRGKHAYKGDEYVELKATTGMLTLTSTVKDGIHTDGYVLVKGGTLTITTSGSGYWDEEEQETKAPACINAAGHVTINGGTIELSSTGDGGKGIKCDSTFTMCGGSLTASTTGARYIDEHFEGDRLDVDNIPDSLKNSPKAVKADLGILIESGTMTLYTGQDGGEGLESKDTITIRGGNIHIEAYDDCVNAAGDIRIHGGNIFLNSLDNDGIDTNQSMFITGGDIVALGNHLHELGIDVNDKSPYKKLYLTSGTIVCVGGTSQVSHPYATDGAQPALYYRGKLKTGTQLLLRCTTDQTEILQYRLDRDYKAEAGGTQPTLCLMLSSPLLQTGMGYELINETSGKRLAFVPSLSETYAYMENEEGNGDSFSLLTGDVNGDYVVNVTDVMLVVNYILGYDTGTFIFTNADVNLDGLINVTDVMLIVNFILGNTNANNVRFSRHSFTLAQSTLPYRRADICHDGTQKPIIVLFLHGGSARGNDNEVQLEEAAVNVICRYLHARRIPATLIVPQCPEGGGWTGRLRRVVNELMKNIAADGTHDPNRIYVMGGSMGGTGSWVQLSNYPDFYAAAMPVAGNPSGCDATNVATTPVRTVMGTSDNMMSIPVVEQFQSEVQAAGGILVLDMETGWSHPYTCEHSYTDERLDWVFSHTRGNESNNQKMKIRDNVDHGVYDLTGRKVVETANGIIVKNGKKIVLKR